MPSSIKANGSSRSARPCGSFRDSWRNMLIAPGGRAILGTWRGRQARLPATTGRPHGPADEPGLPMGRAPRIRIVHEGLTGDVSQRSVDTDDSKLHLVSRLAQFA